jgi:hypothetical protein
MSRYTLPAVRFAHEQAQASQINNAGVAERADDRAG